MLAGLLVGALIPGLFVYYIMSYFLVPVNFTFPMAVLISMLSFGLTRYYQKIYNDDTQIDYEKDDLSGVSKDGISNGNKDKTEKYISNIILTLVYLIFLLTCLIFSKPNLDIIYASWDSIEISSVIDLGTGLVLAFFMPGYPLIILLTRKDRINSLLKVLLAYLCSMLITGLTIYISALYLSLNISELKNLLISINLVILIVFVIYSGTYRSIITVYRNVDNLSDHIITNMGNKFWKKLKENENELLVFGSIFGLLVLYMYYVYGGITIGDQWYHQNRALLFMSGNFKESILANWDDVYPPFQSALLAGVTVLSGNPLVNTYVSIAFLNMTALFAFYYFILMWLPLNMKKAALIASSLFLIGAGFDWTYILYSSVTSSISKISLTPVFFQEQIRASDIIYAPNFMIAAFPDFSTALIYISLPAGFVLLGLIRLDMKNKFSYAAIISMITILGIMSHTEFHIFIIISAILPIIFNVKSKNFMYLAFLLAFAFIYIIDSMIPIGYFSGNKILGIPLINLGIFFVLISWSIYAIEQKLQKHSHPISFWLNELGRKLSNHKIRSYLIPKIVLVWIVVYLYAFSFVVWALLPPDYIDVHRDGITTPWYFYPMRLGVTGLIGLGCILSYVFKRFEKEVFVFGIMMITAFLMGPFYDEQRLTKYLMAGMIGFASFLIYKLLTIMANKSLVVCGMVVGLIVLSASLSTLMFVGYNGLVIDTQDYSHALGRRNFPSMQEMNMLELMRSKIQNGSSTPNIAAFPYEYNPWEGYLVTKLHAFSGLPLVKTFPTSLILNASTIDSFYNLLESSNTKYIIIPSNSTNDGVLPYPTRFALQNFERIYEDKNYQVLEVPSLKGPSAISDNEVGIIYRQDQSLLSEMTNNSVLQFDNNTFDLKDDKNGFVTIKKDNHIEKATLFSNKGNGVQTLWSKELDTTAGINYIEARFRILGENKTGQDLSGLKWSDGGKDYFLYLSNQGLEIGQQSQNNNKTSFSFTNTRIEKNDWAWYKLGVVSLDKSINVYVDNMLKIKVPKTTSDINTEGISKLGIYSVNNTLEIEPMHVAKVPSSEEFYDRKSKYDYDYPISSLALSGIEYEAFADDDYSILSKKTVILPFDPVNLNDTIFNKYIDYARSGGTLVVMNSDDNFGRFSKLFSIESSGNKTKFSYLNLDSENTFVNVSGTVKSTQIKPSSDIVVTASYRDKDNKVVAPLATEKHFPNGGKIILLNNKGYFDAIYDDPRKYFLSLSNFYSLFDLGPDKAIIRDSAGGPTFHFVGHAKISGIISVNGSSLSIGTGSTNSFQNMDVGAISISDKDGKLKSHFKNISVANMSFFGQSEVSINSTGTFLLPSNESHHDYIGISIPNGFNMTVNLPVDEISRAQIVTNNYSHVNPIEVNGGSKIQLYNVRTDVPLLKSVPVLIKSPDITVIGNTSFFNTNFYGQIVRDPDTSLDISGTVKLKFDFVDQYNERYLDGIRTQDITYLESISADGKTTDGKRELKLPADISITAKKQGLVVPIFDIFTSSTNLIVLGSLSLVTILVSLLLRRKGVL